jgi:hypothetical protein
MVFLNWVGPLLLENEEVMRVPPSIPGIYMLHAFAPEFGGYATFYIGKSCNIRRRLLQHLGDRTTKMVIRAARELDTSHWSAAPVVDPSLLARIEAGLIITLGPICNQQVPHANPVRVNLPPLSLRSFATPEELIQ